MHADRFLGALQAMSIALIAALGCVPARSQGGDPPGGGAGAGSFGGATETGGVTSTGGTQESGGTGVDVPGDGGRGGSTGSGGTGGGGASAGGGATGGGTSGRGGAAGTAGTTATNCALGPSFKWSSSDALMDPVADFSHKDPLGLRDPTVVNYGGKYTLYATFVRNDATQTIEAVSFFNWSDAGYSTVYYMDNNTSFSGNHAAAQLFYVAGQKKWYLVSQGGGPFYSTASDPTMSSTFTKPVAFFSSTPSIVTQNAGSGPGWTDFWVICDTTNCHMFFGNNNGYLFRSQTTLSSFPNGFGTPVQVMKGSSANDVYGGVSVYKIKGSSKYLLLVEAAGSNGHYIRSWTGDAIDGSWTALADSESGPFAGLSSSTFSTSTPWTKDIAHGELVRDGYDETMAVNPCSLQYVYQGRDAYTTETPARYPWKLALLTKAN